MAEEDVGNAAGVSVPEKKERAKKAATPKKAAVAEGKVEEAAALCPGMRSPTVIPLADEGWVSLHVVVRDSELWEKVERLKKLGAEGILVLSLENMIK